MSVLSRALSTLALAAAIMLCGSASAETAQKAPVDARPIAVVYSGKAPSGWTDLPTGAYRVPGTSVVISGHQKASALGVIFAGGLGVLAESAVNSERGKRTVGSVENALQVDIGQAAAEATQNALKSGKYGQRFVLTADPGSPTLTVIAFIVITFVNDTEVRPYVVLKATLKPEPAGESSRSTRYFCCGGQPLALTGDNSLTADGGEPLRKLVAQELETAINVMLDDTSNPYVRDERKLINVEANFPFVRQKFKMKGYEISEDEHTIIFATKNTSSLDTTSGIHVLDKSTISYEPAAPRK
jgi:hypothetical protein